VPAAAHRGFREPARECASELYRHDAHRTPLIARGPGVATAHAEPLPARQDQHLPRGASLGLRPHQAGREHFSISMHTLARCRRLRRSPRPTPHNPHSHACISLLIRATGARAPTTTTATSTTPPIPATGRSPRGRSCEPGAALRGGTDPPGGEAGERGILAILHD